MNAELPSGALCAKQAVLGSPKGKGDPGVT